MVSLPAVFLLFVAASATAASPEAASAAAKLNSIHAGQAAPGSTVYFSTREINAYAAQQAPLYVPRGLRNARVELASGTVTGSALIDFLQLRKGTGQTTNWLVAKLIEGERPVKVVATIQSAHSKAAVYLKRVEVGGIGVSGSVLDFLIGNFVKPTFPDIRVNEWFPLMNNVERIDARPGMLTVQITSQVRKPSSPAPPKRAATRKK